MKTKLLSLLLFLFCITPIIAQDFKFNIEDIDIKYQKFTLDNGLTVIIHEDHKAPIVAVNVWYHVGSKNEKARKTGFAHLFEHLMFNGSENYNTDYFEAMESIGATDLNGTTSFDRTNYFQNVPKSAFDIALWMESDRMGHFAGAISQERLDEQRDVVQNEKRQGENQPYGRMFESIVKRSFPANHPYSHTVIGSMDDLNGATLDDVKDWFKNYYGPANATLVIAGDVETNAALEKVKKYFGDIPSGPPVTHPMTYIAKRSGEIRDVMQDRVPQTRIQITWNVPEFGNEDAFKLDLISTALTNGKSSRLYKRLVYDEQLASSVNSYNWENEISGLFVIRADVKPGKDAKKVEAIINEELQKLLKDGLTEQEVTRGKTNFLSGFVKGIERIGGFGGKSDILAMNQVYMGDPEFYKTRLKAYRDLTAEEIRLAGNKWLSDGKYVLYVEPFPEYSTTKTEIDRSKGLPDLGEEDVVEFPEIQKTTLSNGLKVLLTQRNSVPMVTMSMEFDAGFAADQFGKQGTAKLTMNMLDEGTKNRDAFQISDELDMLGTSLYTGSNLDMSFVNMTALKQNFDSSMDLFADVILNPLFSEKEMQRLKMEQIDDIKREKNIPFQMALRVFPKLIYGEGHAYSLPFTGSGYENTVSEITKDDLNKFYSTWIHPNNATLIVVGDITMSELTSKLEELFKKWKSKDVPVKNIATVKPNAGKIYLIDRPGSIQSIVLAGHVADPYGAVNEKAFKLANNILGGEFTSRINMNIREDKGWSYGAFGFLIDTKGQRPYLSFAPVQSDKTSATMIELKKEISEFVTTNKATEKEFEKTKNNEVLSLPGIWETMNSVRNSIGNINRYNLPLNYYQNYSMDIKSIDLKEVQEVASKIIHPENISWIIVGDVNQIKEQVKDLNYGEIIIIDGDGNPL